MKTLNQIQILHLFVVLFFVSSCSTPLKELTYINNIETGTNYVNGPQLEEYRIRSGDQLFIQVISDDPLNAVFLNIINTQTSTGSMGSSSAGMELITFLVDDQGYIEYPQLGKIYVKGLNTSEIREVIQQGVDKYLQSASVFVKLVNRTLTVLGQVGQPGQKLMVKNQLTIFEALGAAGDITDWGNRRNVKLIREVPDGKHIEELDLTDPNIINSPYYYVLPHDVVYVEYSTKVYGAKNMSYTTPVSIATSLVSIGVLILSFFK